MKLGCQSITWGGVVGHPVGVTSVKDLFYRANGPSEAALRDIAAAGYAGVEMFDLVTACSAALLQGEGGLFVVLDPTWEEESRAQGLLTLAFSSSLSSVTHLLQTGYFDSSKLGEVRGLHYVPPDFLVNRLSVCAKPDRE